MDQELASKRAIVTGGRRGIGRAIAATLAAEGASVMIASRDGEGLTNTAEELRQTSGGVIETHVVDNAATVISGPTSTLDSPPETVASAFDEKVLGYLRCARAVLPHMVAQRWGRIINVGGLSSRYVGALASSIRNSAVTTLSKNIADENGGLGITANTVQPGPTDTEQLREMLATRTETEGDEALSRMIERVSTSPRSVAINGITLDVGGGTLGTIFH